MREGLACRCGRGTLYDVLQVSPWCEPEVIQAAYRALARSRHPDLNHDADAEEQMRRLNVAYQTLSDLSRRARYDEELALEAARSAATIAHTANGYGANGHASNGDAANGSGTHGYGSRGTASGPRTAGSRPACRAATRRCDLSRWRRRRRRSLSGWALPSNRDFRSRTSVGTNRMTASRAVMPVRVS